MPTQENLSDVANIGLGVGIVITAGTVLFCSAERKKTARRSLTRQRPAGT
jgi:hypothetical protein